MQFNPEIILFLISVVFISLSGVLMPGPLFAVTLAKGQRDKASGVFVAIGHGLIEIPLMVIIYLGFSYLFVSSVFQLFISLAGGVMLLLMGIGMFKNRASMVFAAKDNLAGALKAGAITSIANPYFLIWWATIGSALILTTKKFGLFGFILFAVIHWLCDFFWLSLVGLAAFKSQQFWSKSAGKLIISGCAVILLSFGIWFIISAIRIAL